MIEIRVDTEAFTRLERSLMAISGKQTRYATAQALNDCARAASVAVNAAMPGIFDRPTRFTDRAAVAPRSLAATADSLAATVTVHPIQAKYLLHEEIGGTRTPAENTRKPSRALTLPGPNQKLDAFGNIPAGTVARLKAGIEKAGAKRIERRQKAKLAAGKRVKPASPRDRGVFYVPRSAARPNLPGGFWGRLPGHRITHLIPFAGEAHYQPRLHYHATVEAAAAATWPKAMLTRLLAAIATAH